MKRLLIFICVAFITNICPAKPIRLGLINPTSRNIEKILFLINQKYIEWDGIEIIGIFHNNQTKLISEANEFIKENGYKNISLTTIRNSISTDSLFVKNACSEQFKELFLKTDGLIFFGGADISPAIYGEKCLSMNVLIPEERNWEISFLFHLTGGFQNKEFTPLLVQKPDYLILGICLGMQEMNVAAGGSLYQDIPFQIYSIETYNGLLNQHFEKQHKNYKPNTSRQVEKDPAMRFHHILISEKSSLNFGTSLTNPMVASVHHQSVKKPGENLIVTATSMDKRVIEAIENSKFPNVYGIQFHTDYTVLYKQSEFKYLQDYLVKFSPTDILFHKLFWKNFSERLKKSAYSQQPISE